LHRRDVCLRVKHDPIHAIELHDEMPIFATKTKRRITVPTRLGIHLDSNFGGAGDGRLYVFQCRRGCNRGRGVHESLVEWIGIEFPVVRTRNVYGDVGLFETVINGGSLGMRTASD
jgi:hypothetical protein